MISTWHKSKNGEDQKDLEKLYNFAAYIILGGGGLYVLEPWSAYLWKQLNSLPHGMLPQLQLTEIIVIMSFIIRDTVMVQLKTAKVSFFFQEMVVEKSLSAILWHYREHPLCKMPSLAYYLSTAHKWCLITLNPPLCLALIAKSGQVNWNN